MIYCDTSLLISALTTEPRSGESQTWIGRQATGDLAISPWVDTEFASAVAHKGRIGDLDDDGRARVLVGWRAVMSRLHVERIQSEDFAHASILVGRPDSRLRSGDALHLAIVERRGFDLATLDNALADYAELTGVFVHQVFEDA